MIQINKKEFFIYSIISFFILIYLQFNAEINRPHSDSLKYIDYAINIHQTGYFGLPKEGAKPWQSKHASLSLLCFNNDEAFP